MNTNGLIDAEDDVGTIPDIIADDMNESGYQEGSENSYGERRDSKEGFAGELDSDSGVDGGVSSGCSIADDCPVVSINDVVAYYDDVRPRRRHAPQLNFYNVDIERLAVDTAQLNIHANQDTEKTNQTNPNSMGLRRLITEFLWPPSSSIIRPWLPYSIKVLVKTNQTSPNSMGLRRLITEFLWPPSSIYQTLVII
ncbi:hypothetical protein EVAR_28093_1 [Eumeta japonica]|uniref:Uncharacterized protein n=1 Tax=Eumeta variegata TaxID=151549 RepID=A0A4C1W9Z6_EUMVA|nr:hypothetical protein EVAR_28093_1 [Eumeta japonica]